MNRIQKLYLNAKKIIPGGTQLLSKRPEMFAPNQWPAYYKKAKGCEVIDLDDNKYIDMCYMGIGSCTLGYADKEVDDAAKNAIDCGSMATLNSYNEVELAKLLCKIHPWAEQVRYTRSGGEAMSVAIRLARAKTKKEIVLFSGYHGWHDWYLSANLSGDLLSKGHLIPGLDPLGVPKMLKGSAVPFGYNNTEEFMRVFNENKNNIAAIVVETVRNMYPNDEFFKTIKSACEKDGIVLIFDEITAGFKLNGGGSHLKFKQCSNCQCKNNKNCYSPDIAVFAKAMTNGYPLAAIIGKKEIMSLAEQTFVSSLYWTESIGPAATIATINKIIREDVPSYTEKLGKCVQEIWVKAAKLNKLELKITGPVPQLSIFSFNYSNDLEIKTLFIQEMLKKGFLTTTAFYPSLAHKKKHLDEYEIALNEVFNMIKNAINKGLVSSKLEGPICHSGFKRLT